jgi:hypothetical protein
MVNEFTSGAGREEEKTRIECTSEASVGVLKKLHLHV